MRRLQQTGSQIIEFALVLPVMIFIILLVMEAGVLAFNKAVITHASKEAARRGAVLTAAAWDPEVIGQSACDAVRDVLITFGSVKPNATCTGGAGPAVTVTPIAVPAFGASITVDIAYPVTGLLWHMAGYLTPGNPAGSSVIMLTASTSMVHE